MARKGLGRGLGVIFGSDADVSKTARKKAADTHRADGKGAAVGSAQDAENSFVGGQPSRETASIDISLIVPNSSQPRKNFDEESMRELADSIAQHGVLQPVLLKRKKGRYEIVIGERRYRAARMAGLKTIPAIIKDMSPREAAEAALIENIQREDLGSIEEARAYEALIDEYDMTQEELAKRLSKSRTAVTNSLRLLKLDPEILTLVEEEKLSAGHARALLAAKRKEDRLKLAHQILEKGLSVRQTEKLAAALSKTKVSPSEKPGKAEKACETAEGSEAAKGDEFRRYLKAAENELTEAMNTKVSIRPDGASGTKGRIEIEYYSEEELNGIIETLLSKG